jgi:tetratricopeptide (TPR) repeat protein
LRSIRKSAPIEQTEPRRRADGEVRWVIGRPAPSGGIHVLFEGKDFRSFSAARDTLQALSASLPISPLRTQLETTAVELSRTADGEDLSPSGSIVFAVIRRISRESHHSALLIDRLARLILAAMDSAPLRGETLVLHRFDLWDRPSLRTLCRVLALRKHERFPVVCLLGALPVPRVGSDSLATRLVNARASFFCVVEEQLRPVQEGQGGAWSWNARLDESARGAGPFELANELSYQNYERVYALASSLLDHELAPPAERQTDLWRLVAIADTNVGWIDLALATLDHAETLATVPTAPPFLEYLKGLVYAKRLYDLERAEHHFRLGLGLLAAIPFSPEHQLEEAWLKNGLALTRSLMAKGEPHRRDALIREAFDLEMSAYRLVATQRGPAFSYLRHNLLANITFLFEITGQYAAAIQSWRRSFERYLAADDPAFDIAYFYRLGLLRLHSGQVEEGLEGLGRALRRTRELRDVFYEDRVTYAVGWGLLQAGRREEARRAFEEGAQLAEQLSLPDSEDQHLIGMAATAPLADERGMPAGGTEDRSAPIDVARPSPKLPAYIPGVDLEGTPPIDINRYLVTNDAHRGS